MQSCERLLQTFFTPSSALERHFATTPMHQKLSNKLQSQRVVGGTSRYPEVVQGAQESTFDAEERELMLRASRQAPFRPYILLASAGTISV